MEGRRLLGARTDSRHGEVSNAIDRASRGEGEISFMLDGLPGAGGGPAKALAAARNTRQLSSLDTQWARQFDGLLLHSS